MPSCSIVEAGCAAIASRDISGPVTISDSYQLHLDDASPICANPAIELVEAAIERISREKKVGAFISIEGQFTGFCGSNDRRRHELMRNDAEKVHSHFRRCLGSSNVYFRFSPRYNSFIGVQDRGLRENVLAYMREDTVRQLVHKLVSSSLLGKNGRLLSAFCKYPFLAFLLRLTDNIASVLPKRSQLTIEVDLEDQKPEINSPGTVSQPMTVPGHDDERALVVLAQGPLYAEMNNPLIEETMDYEQFEEGPWTTQPDTPIVHNSSNSVPTVPFEGTMNVESPIMEFQSNSNIEMHLPESVDSLRAELEILERLQETRDDSDRDILSSMSRIAFLSHRLGKHQDSIKYEKMVMTRLASGHWNQPSQDYLRSASNLAFYKAEAGELKDALHDAEYILKKKKELLTENDPDSVAMEAKLLPVYLYMARYDELLRKATKVLNICKGYNPQGDSDISQEMIKDLQYKAKTAIAECHWILGESNKALPIMQEALALSRELYGHEHPETLWATILLSLYHSAEGDHKLALENAENVLIVCRRTIGEEHPVTIGCKDHIAIFLSYLEKDKEALRISQEVVEARKKLLGDKHLDTLAANLNMATYTANLGETKKALEIEEMTLKSCQYISWKDHPTVGHLLENMANNCSLLGRHTDAQKHGEAALVIVKMTLGENHPSTKSLEETVRFYRANVSAVKVGGPDLYLLMKQVTDACNRLVIRAENQKGCVVHVVVLL
jgi:tetratricopeptide (TPR) repeat protein